MPNAILQYWEESERGWGTRPDGATLYRNSHDADAGVKRLSDYYTPLNAPDEYTRPSHRVEVEVSPAVFRSIGPKGKTFWQSQLGEYEVVTTKVFRKKAVAKNQKPVKK